MECSGRFRFVFIWRIEGFDGLQKFQSFCGVQVFFGLVEVFREEGRKELEEFLVVWFLGVFLDLEVSFVGF